MAKKLIISNLYNNAALICESQTQEIISIHNDYQIGDIYVGVINKIFQSIDAAFVNLQPHKKSGFIHANDSSQLNRKSRITKIFTINQKILVQIVKESTLRKGPKLTTNITLSGQYITLMPFNNTTCIARSVIGSKQRYILKALAILLKPFNMGLLFRHSSAGVSEESLIKELDALKKQWNFIRKSTVYSVNPCLIYRNNNIVRKVLHDFYIPSVKNIFIDSNLGLLKFKNFFYHNAYYSQCSDINLKLLEESKYHSTNAGTLVKIIENLKDYIQLHLGGYIIIETSEALTTIDVNSGSFNNASNSRETALRTNCIAATEIAHQLRKQNITGIIIVDFINMRRRQEQFQLLRHFSQVLEGDKTKPRIVQLSELGLVEIVRRRTSKNLQELYNKYLLPMQHQHYLTTKRSIYDINFNYWLSTMAHKTSSINLFTDKHCDNSIFFKKVLLVFYHLIYKKKNIYSALTNIRRNICMNVSSIHLSYYYSNMTSTFSYTSMITHYLL